MGPVLPPRRAGFRSEAQEMGGAGGAWGGKCRWEQRRGVILYFMFAVTGMKGS